MSLNSVLSAALAILLSGCSLTPAAATGVCPSQNNQPLRFVDIFDGPAEDLATLVPDQAKETYGYWQLGYVYDAKRYVTVRCKYADGTSRDVKLMDRINRCDYKIDADKTLEVHCK